jgi:hypothetical protein
MKPLVNGPNQLDSPASIQGIEMARVITRNRVQGALQFSIIFFSLLAAALWLWASLEPTVDQVATEVQSRGMDIFGGDLATLARGLVVGSQRNAWAAMCAGIAAALQAASTFIQYCLE